MIALAFLCLLWPTAALAQPISVTVDPSTTAATLGNPVPFQAEARIPSGAALELDLERSATDVFAIQRLEPASAGTGAVPSIIRFDVLPLALGDLPVHLVFRVAQGPSASRVEAVPVILHVSPPKGVSAASEIQDIKGPLKARRPLWIWLLAALLAAALYAWRRRHRAPGGPEAASKGLPPSPEEWARGALEALRGSTLWAEGRRREFYFELTEILRLYLERRLRIPAPRMTTSELLRNLRQAELDKNLTGSVRKIMDRADLVKFAKFPPQGGWGEEDIDAALSIVSALAPAPPPGGSLGP